MLRCPVDIVLSAERFQVDPAACCSAARNCARIDARTLCSAEVFPNEPFRTAKSRDAHRREDVPFLRRNSTPDRSLEVCNIVQEVYCSRRAVFSRTVILQSRNVSSCWDADLRQVQVHRFVRVRVNTCLAGSPFLAISCLSFLKIRAHR